MTSCLNLLPPELLEDIFSQLASETLLKLSSTCKLFLSTLAPRIFETIRFTNDVNIAESALLAARSYGQHTRRIEFTTGGPVGAALSQPCLVPAAAALLRGDFTPDATCAVIKFSFDYENDELEDIAYEEGSIYVFEDDEDDADVRPQQERLHWRKLMSEAWTALAQNNAIKELEVPQLPLKKTSAFQEPSFRRFLGQLERASFDVLYMDNGAGWDINTVDGFAGFVGEMGDILFKHMNGLKSLTLRSESPIGLPSRFAAALPLQAEHLPALQELKLHHCYVGKELLDFLKTANVLKTLDINECYACHPDAADDEDFGTTWAAFFDKMVEMRPKALTTLVVGEKDIPLKRSWDNSPDSEQLQRARADLAGDKTLKVFGYANTDDKYGTLYDSVEDNLDSFEERKDYEAYKRIMAVVEANASTGEAI